MSANPYETNLDKTPANYQPLQWNMGNVHR